MKNSKKRMSVKSKITLWLTVLMATLAGILMGFMLLVSESVATKAAMDHLTRTVRGNLAWIEVTEQTPTLGDGFQFYQSGVTTLIYSQKEALLAGQVPLAFTSTEAFQNGVAREVNAGNTTFLVLDVWLPSDWESGVWVRGLMEAPANASLSGYLLRMAVIALPVFMILAALGSYWLIRRAFRPLDMITATAETINEAKDLSGRIGLPPGKDEFSRLAQNFDAMFERLERSFEAEKQFTADASHELRTPVSIIKGACEYGLKYDETPEERRETLEMIQRQADQMSGLISQLLNMTRLEQGTEKPHFERMNLSTWVREYCETSEWDQGRLSVEAEASVWVDLDRELLGRLLRNLVENGFKYGMPEGMVRVSVAEEKGEALLLVADDGIGIAPEEQEKIWKRFYQVDSSRGDHAGTGLGLAIVQQIARLHEGYLTLESEPGKGSVFCLHLPAKNQNFSETFM